jgi:hypothetical protein
MTGGEQGDVEYVIVVGKSERVFNDFDEALSYAFAAGLSVGRVTIDVLVYSEAGARAFGGDDSVTEYRDDPEASVFRRVELTIKDMGRVP